MSNNQLDGQSVSYSKLYRYYVLHNLENFHIALVAISAILYLVGKFARNDLYGTIGLWVLYAAVLSFVIHWNQRKLYFFMRANSDISYLPAKQIQQINNFFLLIFVVLSGILMYFFPRTPYKRVTSVIGGFFKTLIGYFLHFFFRDTAYSGFGEVLKTNINYDSVNVAQKQDSVLDILLKLFESLMSKIAVVFLIILAICVLVWAFRKFLSGHSTSDIEQHEFVRTEMKREKLDREARAVTRLSLFGNDPNTKIRKQYIKTVQKYDAVSHKGERKKVVRRNSLSFSPLTPAEIESRCQIPNDERRSLLHHLYEKARYSEHGCSAEDLNQAKNTNL